MARKLKVDEPTAETVRPFASEKGLFLTSKALSVAFR